MLQLRRRHRRPPALPFLDPRPAPPPSFWGPPAPPPPTKLAGGPPNAFLRAHGSTKTKPSGQKPPGQKPTAAAPGPAAVEFLRPAARQRPPKLNRAPPP